MQVSPSLDMTVGRFGVWRAGVAALVALAAAASAAWGFVAPAPLPVAQALGLALATGCIAASAATALRQAAVRLRWDGQRWSIAVPGAGGEPTPVDPPTVTLDLGVWMLLHLRHEGAPRRRGHVWLPVQRRGHEAHWHALRCAVYSPRPAPGGPSAAEP
jgi:hypothetical protein